MEMRPDFVSGPQGLTVVEFPNIVVAIEVKIGKKKGNSPKSSWLLLRPGFGANIFSACALIQQALKNACTRTRC